MVVSLPTAKTPSAMALSRRAGGVCDARPINIITAVREHNNPKGAARHTLPIFAETEIFRRLPLLGPGSRRRAFAAMEAGPREPAP